MVKKIESRLTKSSVKAKQADHSNRIAKKQLGKGSNPNKDTSNKTLVQKEKSPTKKPIKKLGKKITKNPPKTITNTPKKIKT